jgi:hypothetical protein
MPLLSFLFLLACDQTEPPPLECPDCPQVCEDCEYIADPRAECPPEETSCITGHTRADNTTEAYKPETYVAMNMHENNADGTNDCSSPVAMRLSYDIGQDCFGWTRTVTPGTGNAPLWEKTRDNSGACFTCMVDGEGNGALCFQEYTGTLTCEAWSPQGYIASKTTEKLFTTAGCQSDAGGAASTTLVSMPDDGQGCLVVADGDFAAACTEALKSCKHPQAPSWTGRDSDHETLDDFTARTPGGR